MFKISTVGWHTCLQSLAVVFHSIVNGFLRQCSSIQLKCICKLGNCFLLRLQLVIRLSIYPKPDKPVDWCRMNWGPLIIGDEVTAIWLDETGNLKRLKTMNTPGKINAILLNIKINRQKLVNMCGRKLATHWQNFTEIYLTWVKILHKVLGNYFFTHTVDLRRHVSIHKNEMVR